MTAPRVGTAPINWYNLDIPDWTPELPAEEVLRQMHEADYAGTEIGHNYPTEPEALREALARHELALSGAYQWLHILEWETPGRETADRRAVEQLAALLAGQGAEHLIVAEAFTPARWALAGRVPADDSAGLHELQWEQLADGLHTIGRICQGHGLRMVYHNHAGTYVETPAELATLCNITDQDLVGLCLDCGHFVYGGGDPVEAVRNYGSRIRYVHLKDVDAAVLARMRAEGGDFEAGLRNGIFVELGRGSVDLPGFISALRAHEYTGWLVVEQDTSPRPALESALESREYLRATVGL